MKNIHLLPTNKPSRLFYYNSHLGLARHIVKKNDGVNTQHIYITSDEEIKEGDWFMSDFNSFPLHNIKELSEREETLGWKQENLKNNLKIILTTDQDLIKDGVQAIDDEFLQWFVSKANDSGKPIDIVEVHKMCYGALSGFSDAGYKIIIPKEEQKQHLIDMMKDDEELGLYKQQTAVEWLFFEMKGTKWINADWEKRRLIIEQAKEMEKQQIFESWDNGFDNGNYYGKYNENCEVTCGEQYYNKTYKK